MHILSTNIKDVPLMESLVGCESHDREEKNCKQGEVHDSKQAACNVPGPKVTRTYNTEKPHRQGNKDSNRDVHLLIRAPHSQSLHHGSSLARQGQLTAQRVGSRPAAACIAMRAWCDVQDGYGQSAQVNDTEAARQKSHDRQKFPYELVSLMSQNSSDDFYM